MKTLNIPYVKKYDKNGDVTNPIGSGYFSNGENRKQRRAKSPTHRFIGCGRNLPLTVVGASKYIRQVQNEIDEDGNRKKIFHYLPIK
jgi:hypothetical protein